MYEPLDSTLNEYLHTELLKYNVVSDNIPPCTYTTQVHMHDITYYFIHDTFMHEVAPFVPFSVLVSDVKLQE